MAPFLFLSGAYPSELAADPVRVSAELDHATPVPRVFAPDSAPHPCYPAIRTKTGKSGSF